MSTSDEGDDLPVSRPASSPIEGVSEAGLRPPEADDAADDIDRIRAAMGGLGGRAASIEWTFESSESTRWSSRTAETRTVGVGVRRRHASGSVEVDEHTSSRRIHTRKSRTSARYHVAVRARDGTRRPRDPHDA